MMKTKLAKKLALIATGTAIGGPLGTAVGIVSTGMDIRDIALLAQYYVDEAVGGIATGGRSLPGRSQADIGDEIAKAEKNLKNLDPNDSWLPSMGPGSYESLKAHYEKQLADLKKERDLPQEIARKRSELFNQSNLAYAKDFDDKEAEKNAFSADNIDNIPLGPPGPGADPETTPDAALAGGGGITTRQPPLVPGTSSSPGPGGSGATPGKKKVKVRRTSGGRGISGGGNIARAGRITHKARFKTGMGIKDIQKKLKAYFPEQSITFGTLREQAELSANPYTEPDGKWGKETYNAVIAFQKDLKKLMVAGKLKVTLPSGKTANEYLVDGIFGPDTAAATKAAEEAGLLVPGLKLDTSSVGPTKPSATKGPTKPAVKGELNTDGKAAKKIFFDMANKALQKVPQGIERDMAVKAYADSLASSWTADQLNQIGKGLKEFDKAKAETQKILDAEAEKYRKKVAAAQAIKDKKDREERLAQQALAAAEAARAGAMNFYHNNIAQGAQRLPEESKAYAYLEKLINEEINKLLG
jgi:peptidoglycan hydrolase-like protein with peptidoglycan-binding domain